MNTLTDLANLRRGETVEATDPNGRTIRCVVEVAAPHLGVLWAWDLDNLQRILIPAEDLKLRATPRKPRPNGSFTWR